MSTGGITFEGNQNNINGNGAAAYIGSVDQFGTPLTYLFQLKRSYTFPQWAPYAEPVVLFVSYLNGAGQASAISQNGYGASIQSPAGAPWPSFQLLTFYNGNFIDGLTGWNLGGQQGTGQLGYPTYTSYHDKPAVKFGNANNYSGTLAQVLQTTPGQFYQLSYSLASTGGDHFFSQVGGTTTFDTLVNTDIQLSPAYSTITSTFQATSATTDLLFSGKATGSFYLTDVSLITVEAPKPKLTIQITGSGGGTVSDATVGFSCGSTCQQDITWNTPLNLTAEPFQYSLFTGWTGAGCLGAGTCSFTILDPITVSANFDIDYPHSVRALGPPQVFYPSLQSAFDAASGVVQAWGVTFAESLSLNRSVTIILLGSYDAYYGGPGDVGVTTLQGTLTIEKGSLIVDRVAIR
jgi:hypothetical protein